MIHIIGLVCWVPWRLLGSLAGCMSCPRFPTISWASRAQRPGRRCAVTRSDIGKIPEKREHFSIPRTNCAHCGIAYQHTVSYNDLQKSFLKYDMHQVCVIAVNWCSSTGKRQNIMPRDTGGPCHLFGVLSPNIFFGWVESERSDNNMAQRSARAP